MKSRLKPIFNIFTLCALLLSLLGSAVTVTPVRAAITSVSTAAELIAAINTANTNGQSDTITLTDNIILTSVDNTTDGANGLPSILSDGGNSLTIDGNGFSISRSGATAFRILHIQSGADVLIKNIDIENGLASAPGLGTLGGGMYTAGDLTIENSTFSGNTATTTSGFGSAIFVNKSNLTIISSYFTGNSSASGTVYNYQNSATITNSTFVNNTAPYGGGAIGNESSNTTLTNNTLSGNQSTSLYGGAIYNLGGTSVLTNNTIVYNSAGSGGGGIYNLAGNITLRNNIIAGNTAPTQSQCYNDTVIGGTILTADSYNIFGTNNDAGGCPAGSTDVVPSSGISSIISSLANNGGPTMTHAIFLGSPAVNTGGNGNCPGTDQRGVPRPQDGICDIGAYEYGTSIPPRVSGLYLPGSISILESQAITLGITQVIVRFDQNVTSGGGSTAADNPSNYLLVRTGSNGIQTTSCAGGVTGADVSIAINSVSYTNNGGVGPFEATLNFNGGTALPAGTYELFACGTTSITNVFGEELNGGFIDFHRGFTIPTTTTTSGTSGSTNGSGGTSSLVSLPSTGFAPMRVTSIPNQPADSPYIRLSNLWLEIPSLNVKSDIVGVPQSGNEWDVTWLGNNIGWLNGTAFPTWEGNSVLTAHVTNASGLAGPFAELNKLKHGAQIIIHMDGQSYVFEVRESKLVRPDTTAFALQDLGDNAFLTLITCQGYNPLTDTYLFRRVVRAVLVEIK